MRPGRVRLPMPQRHAARRSRRRVAVAVAPRSNRLPVSPRKWVRHRVPTYEQPRPGWTAELTSRTRSVSAVPVPRMCRDRSRYRNLGTKAAAITAASRSSRISTSPPESSSPPGCGLIGPTMAHPSALCTCAHSTSSFDPTSAETVSVSRLVGVLVLGPAEVEALTLFGHPQSRT